MKTSEQHPKDDFRKPGELKTLWKQKLLLASETLAAGSKM